MPIALDEERRWLLLPDGGPTLGETGAGPDEVIAALASYGRLQRALAPHAEEMLALGVPDMRPPVMPARFVEALEFVGEVPEVAALEPVVGELVRAPRRVAAAGLARPQRPASLEHPRRPALLRLGRQRGRASVRRHARAARHDPAPARRRGAGAGPRRVPGGLHGPHEELVATLELACRVAKIARTLTWVRAIEAGGDVDPDWATAPAETLAGLLADDYLG